MGRLAELLREQMERDWEQISGSFAIPAGLEDIGRRLRREAGSMPGCIFLSLVLFFVVESGLLEKHFDEFVEYARQNEERVGRMYDEIHRLKMRLWSSIRSRD